MNSVIVSVIYFVLLVIIAPCIILIQIARYIVDTTTTDETFRKKAFNQEQTASMSLYISRGMFMTRRPFNLENFNKAFKKWLKRKRMVPKTIRICILVSEVSLLTIISPLSIIVLGIAILTGNLRFAVEKVNEEPIILF